MDTNVIEGRAIGAVSATQIGKRVEYFRAGKFGDPLRPTPHSIDLGSRHLPRTQFAGFIRF
jgi:hypothetical protein